MSKTYEKTKLLQVLSETPLVSSACKKTGISRATYYRWYKDDKNFRDNAIEFLSVGRKNITDLAESMLIKEISKGNMNSIRFWLQHNEPRYRPIKTDYIEPADHYHELKRGETCKICGHYNAIDPEEVGTKRLTRKRLIRNALEKIAQTKWEKEMERKFAFLTKSITGQENQKDLDNKNSSGLE